MANKVLNEGTVLIFAGPHGAGKDTIEGEFRQQHPGTERIVRHITRAVAPGEIDGETYHYLNESDFEAMASGDLFIEHFSYPDCRAGTSWSEVTSKINAAEFSSLTGNFEEGLSLHRKLGAAGLKSICFFVSPVSREIIHSQPEAYIDVLSNRMINRGRPADRIANKLAKAEVYRELFLANETDVAYINNSDGSVDAAVRDVERSLDI